MEIKYKKSNCRKKENRVKVYTDSTEKSKTTEQQFSAETISAIANTKL